LTDSINFDLKKLLFILTTLLSSYFSYSQCLSGGDFEGGYPAGWTQSSTYINGSPTHGGSKKLGMNSAGDKIVTTAVVDPCDLSLWVRTSSDPDNWVLEVQTAINTAGPWTTQLTITENGAGGAVTNTYNQFSVALNLIGTFYIRVILVSRSTGSCYIDDLELTCGCVACPGLDTEPTNESTSLTSASTSCTTGDINWTISTDATNSIVVVSTSAITGTPTDGVAYNANSVFGSGDQLNAGEYIVYNGSGGNVSISGLTDNTTYFITVFGYNGNTANCDENYLTGGNSTSFTTTTGCASSTPQITSILYNSCNGSNEGTDEIFTFTTGTDPIDIDDILIEYPNGDDFCNGGPCPGNENINNPTYVNDLNTMAGCTVFAYANPIPPNSDVMVFTGNPPSTVLDYSSQCGAANLPVYVIFNTNTSTAGRFSNSAVRTLIVSFGGGMSDTVTYDGSAQASTDGATVNFDAPGNPSYFISTDCVYPLPVDLLYFNGSIKNDITTINWETGSERNNNYFKIEKSINGYDYTEIGFINGHNNLTNSNKYNFIDKQSTTFNTTYYRLKQYDYDEKMRTSYPIQASNQALDVYYHNNKIITKSKSHKLQTLNIYNISGQLIHTQYIHNNMEIDWTKKGFYIIEIPELQIRQKIICY